MAFDRDGVLFFQWPGQGRVVRRSADGHWEDIKGLNDLKKNCNRAVIARPFEERSYVVDSNQFSSVFYRIEGNVVHPPHLTVHGCGTEYLARWQRLFVGLFVAWLIHLGVLSGGIVWLRRGMPQSSYRFGNRCATLAPIHRRVLAGSVDFLFLLAAVFLLTYMQSTISGIGLNTLFGVELKLFTEDEVCECLFEYEDAISIGTRQGFDLLFINLRSAAKLSVALLFRPVPSHPSFVFVKLAEVLSLIALMIYAEGRLGVTPGQWLFRIRTLRSTLLPCGFARSLVRSVLYWVDNPFFVTPIPAAMSLMLSTSHQRIGDRVADTVVVNARRCDLHSMWF